MKLKTLPLVWLLFLTASQLWSQTASTQAPEWWQQINIQPVAILQVWSSYTMGQQVYDEATGTYLDASNRLNFQLRRSRIGLKGDAGKRLKFNFSLAADLVGRDLLAGTEGGANNGPWPRLRLWNAYLLWQLLPEKEGLYLSTGFQVPQLGRISTASAFRSPSMEKPWSQNYLRRHLVGTGPGRSIGLQLGGLIASQEANLWSGRYDIGIFNPAMTALSGNSAGLQTSPLITMRYRLSYGAPESKSYGLTTPVSFFGQRHGASLSFSGAWQGKNDFYQHNHAFGADVLINLGWWTIDAEWFRLGRQGKNETNGRASYWTVGQTGHFRISRLYPVDKHHLETTLTYTFFQGPMNEQDQEQAQATMLFAGEEWYAEAAINWYFSKNLKISGSYTVRDGSPGAYGPGADFNNYLFQSGVGPIQRGNWLGAGLVAIF